MASAANFILKAYATEQNARDDANPLAVSSTTAAGGSIINNPSQAAGYGFWAFQRYWYRIEANEPVPEFYIDWDDGEDNSPEKANVSIIKNKKPTFFGITSHIYTQSKKFYPLIRVKSIEGYLSKWYTPHAGSGTSALNTFAGLDDSIKTTAASTLIYDSGQNSFSVISVERNSSPTGTLTFYTGDRPDATDTLTIVTADGTAVTYTAGASEDASAGTWHASNTTTTQVDSLQNCIEHTNGHGSKITASQSGAGLILTLVDNTSGHSASISKTGATDGQILIAQFGSTYTASSHARIPVFEPANVPPIGVLKTDRKRLFSNIDNDLLGKKGRILNGITAFGTMPYTDTVQAYCSNAARTGIQVKVTYQEAITGGVKAVASIRLPAKGSGDGTGDYLATDLADQAMVITTMDDTYCAWWNLGGEQPEGSPPPTASGHIPIIAVPVSTGGSGGDTVTTCANLVSSMVSALDTALFPASGGRKEFTVSATDDGPGTVEVITITHNNAGPPVEAGAWISTSSDIPPHVNPFDQAYGGGTSTVEHTTGVSPSGGNTKQKTLTTTSAGHANSRIEKVERILRAELVNNLEATDSYGDASGAITTKLYPGERVYLMSTISTTNNYSLQNLAMRNKNPNLHNTICYLSLGNPLLELNSIGGYSTIDASESKIRCSNKSAAFYYFDDNKLISGDPEESDGGTNLSHMSVQNHQTVDTTDASFGITDKLVDGIIQKTTNPARELRYSHEWFREHTDSNYRFYPQKRLIRCQVDDDHTQVADDSFSRSPIEHWDYSGYLKASGAGNQDNNQPTEVSKYNYGALIFTNKAQLRAPNWVDLNTYNKADKFALFQCVAISGLTPPFYNQLLASTSFDTETAADYYIPDNRGDAAGATDNSSTGPRNAVFMTKKEKYDRIFVRVSHDLFNAAALDVDDITNNPTPGTTACMPKVRLQILYPVKSTSAAGSSEDKVVWKALPYVDGTRLKGKDDSTFYKSGDITFTPPSDWAKTSHTTMNPSTDSDTNIIYPFEDNFFEDGSGSTGINDVWTQDSYALIFLVTVIVQGAEATKNCFSITSMYPYSNSHSQLLEIVDPTHVSLNKYGIAQSVSFVRKGKYQEIKDRSGISQMRRIGAEGGNIKLGSIDLKGDAQSTRAKFQEFQQDAVPVYYDVVHRDSSITRMFGVMVDMSEDHPTGKVIPKFACSMKITHILELDSSGNILDDGYVPLGGDVIDVSQYLSAV